MYVVLFMLFRIVQSLSHSVIMLSTVLRILEFQCNISQLIFVVFSKKIRILTIFIETFKTRLILSLQNSELSDRIFFIAARFLSFLARCPFLFLDLGVEKLFSAVIGMSEYWLDKSRGSRVTT